MAGARGKPWSRLGQGMTLDKRTLHRLGRVLVSSVRGEAAKEIARQAGLGIHGVAQGLPRSPRFLDSFGYRIVGRDTLEITSTWPFAEEAPGRPGQSPIARLAQDIGKVQTTQEDGTVIIRSAPKQRSNAWVHPGWARHRFMERGVARGREAMAEIVVREVLNQLKSGDPTR